MRVVKAVLVGVLAAGVAAIAVGALLLWRSIGVTTQSYSYSDAGGGIGADVVVFNTAAPMLVAMVAGVSGFVWQWKRARRRQLRAQ